MSTLLVSSHSPHSTGFQWRLCGWIERIPGGTRENDGLETGLWGADGHENSVELPHGGSASLGSVDTSKQIAP